jgi:hypothetical protein
MLALVFCKFPEFCQLQKHITMTKETAIVFFSDPTKSNKILTPHYLSRCLSFTVFTTLAFRSVLTCYVCVICSSHIVLLHMVCLTIRYNKWWRAQPVEFFTTRFQKFLKYRLTHSSFRTRHSSSHLHLNRSLCSKQI